MRAVALRPLLVLLAAPAHGFSGAGRVPRPLHRRACDRGCQGGARVALLRIRMEEASTTLGCKYDHLQFFVDDLRPLSHYKAIEDRLNEFARLVPRAEGAPVDIAAAREVWRKMGDSADPNAFEVHGRDLVEQMLYGFGWRITGQHEGAETRSLLLSTPDTAGVRFVLTCNTRGGTSADSRPTAAVVMATSNPNPSPNPNPNPSPNPNRSPSPNPNPSPSPSRNPNPNPNPNLERHAGLQRGHILAPSRHAAHRLEQACAEGLLIRRADWLLTPPAKKRVEPLRLEEELHLG